MLGDVPSHRVQRDPRNDVILKMATDVAGPCSYQVALALAAGDDVDSPGLQVPVDVEDCELVDTARPDCHSCVRKQRVSIGRLFQ